MVGKRAELQEKVKILNARIEEAKVGRDIWEQTVYRLERELHKLEVELDDTSH